MKNFLKPNSLILSLFLFFMLCEAMVLNIDYTSFDSYKPFFNDLYEALHPYSYYLGVIGVILSVPLGFLVLLPLNLTLGGQFALIHTIYLIASAVYFYFFACLIDKIIAGFKKKA